MIELRLSKMTVKDAELRWCPFSRAGLQSGNAGVAVNRHYDPKQVEEETRCVGDRCMAWRWEEGIMLDPSTNDLVVKPKGGERRPALGFCGLAGAPLP